MIATALNLRGDRVVVLPELGDAWDRDNHDHDCGLPGATARLLRYWRVMLPQPVAARRRALDAVCARARRNATASEVLPFALGDPDYEIVYRATLSHVGAYPWRQVDPKATADAIEWVRRRLALNCAAVFAALLSLGDDCVVDSLLPLRSTLEAHEIAAIRRRVGTECPEPARTFLQTWDDLLAQSGGVCR